MKARRRRRPLGATIHWQSVRSGENARIFTKVGRCTVFSEVGPREAAKPYRWYIIERGTNHVLAAGSTNTWQANQATAVSRARGRCT